jgi:iron complex outermembrane receptor protein
MKLHHLSSLLLLTSISPEIYSEEFGDEFFPNLPIVTSASRLAESVLSSSSSVTVLDRAMIEASGFVELADVFRLVPGFQVAYVNGHTFAVVPHGGGWEYPNRLQLLIDGRSTYVSSLSAIDWTTLGIHLEDIERIEVVRGPASSAYGSNSFAGAINVITRDPQLDDNYHVSARIGNKGEREVLLRHSANIDDLAYRVTASTLDSSGFDSLDDSRDLNNLNFSARQAIGYSDTIKTDFSYTNGSTSAENLDGVMHRDNRDIKAISGHINWSHILSDSEELKINFFHNFRQDNDMRETYLMSELFNITPAAFQGLTGQPDQRAPIGERTSLANRTDIEAQYSQVNPNGMQFVVGFGSRYDTLASKSLFPRAGTVSDTSFRFFGNLQLPLRPYLTANVGGLYEVSRIENSHLSPKMSLNWHLSAQQTIRTSVSRAYRMPSLLEKHIDTNIILSNGLIIDRIYTSSDELKAEHVDSYELGYLGQFQQLPINWEFKAYKEQYRDLIAFVGDYTVTSATDSSVRRVINFSDMNAYGIEGEITYRPQENNFLRFQFNLGHGTGYTATRIYSNAVHTNSLDRTVPRQSWGLLGSKQLFDLQWSMGVYHISNSEWRSAGDIVDAYTRVDINIAKQIALDHDRTVTIKLGAQNVAGCHYNEFRDDVEFEPRYFLTLALTQR